MKTLPWLFAAGLLGALIGASVAGAYFTRQLRWMIPSHLAMLEQGQERTCMISLAALTKLEAGDVDQTKAILAGEVATFYRRPWQADGPQRKKIVEVIEATREKSAVLREELKKAGH